MQHSRGMALGVAALTVAAVAFAAVGVAQAISGGTAAPAGAYPFAASLSMPSIKRADGTAYASACSGALVAPRWVITAGHCAHDTAGTRVGGAPRYTIDVTVGQTRTGRPARVVKVVQNPSVDVALVELDAPVTSAAPVAVSRTAPAAGQPLVLAGWGSLDGTEDPAHRPDRLQSATYQVVRPAPGTVSVRSTGPRPTTSACPFDSGAPYLSTGPGAPRLVATEIGGPGCPHSGEETTARSDVLARWITAQTATAP